jgi:hypothetical protein
LCRSAREHSAQEHSGDESLSEDYSAL